ncbi:MAG TPA: hypothetical protein QGF58_21380 [Myxococcota bacterium]|nr:hypothetical protein [Myxococcota bacterium]
MLLIATAFAQDPPVSEETQDEAAEVARAMAEQLSALSSELQAAQQSADATQAELDALRELHDQAATLANLDSSEEERLAAAMALAQLEGGLLFVESATESRNARISVGVLPALTLAGEPGFHALNRTVRHGGWGTTQAAVDELVGAGDPVAGALLYDLAVDDSLPRSLRNQALKGLQQHYPEVLAERGEPTDDRSTFVGVAGVTTGSGLTGGILLSSVGVWGQRDAAIAIGAVGGSGIGLGGGTLYGLTQPVSSGQGLRYASNVGWGLVSSELLTQVVLDPYPLERDRAANRRRQNQSALLRTLGTGAGAGLGLARITSYDAEPRDVLESDLAGFVGMQLGFGATGLVLDRGSQWSCYEPNSGNDCADYKTWYRARYGSALVGSAAGLAIAGVTREQWDPRFSDHLYSGIVAGEATWIAGFAWASGRQRTDPDALLRTTATSAFAATEVFAHWKPRSYYQDLGASYGMVAGNALGAGIPFIADEDRVEVVSRVMLPMGAAGTVAGTVLAERTAFDEGDVTLVTLGTPILIAQSAAYAGYFGVREDLSKTQVAGVVLTTASLSSFTLGAAAQRTSPRPMDVLAISTGAAWGAWYGVMTPIAMELEGPEETLLLTGAATSNAFMLGTAGVIYGLDLESRHLFVPQLGAVTGATLGALGVALFDPDGRHIPKGAIIGSVVGFAGGGIAESLRPKKGWRPTLLRPNPRLPGGFSFAAAPTSLEGEMGVYLQLDWREEG